MTIRYVEGDIAGSDAPIIVNTVNCVGVMGAGVAKAVKGRFPEVFPRYEEACRQGRLRPGKIMISPTSDKRQVLNLVTKNHWRDPSRPEWVGGSLLLMNLWLTRKVPEACRIAMPFPGAGNGGMDPALVNRMIKVYLAPALAKGFELDIYGTDLPCEPGQVFYAGVGSRDTPDDILQLMREFGHLAGQEGWLLRSGGARGADRAFHDGARRSGMPSRIYLSETSRLGGDCLFATTPVHRDTVSTFHPRPDLMNPSGIELMARNACQVFGEDFTNPSRLVVCWTEGGGLKGGTAQAIRMAKAVGMPVLNFGKPELKGITPGEALVLARTLILQRESECGLAVRASHPEPAI